MGRMTRWVAVVVACGVLAPGARATEMPMTAGGARIRPTVLSVREQRWRNVIRQGMDVSCGTAALATVLHYEYGDGVSEQELIGSILKHVKEEEVRRRGGFSLLDLKRAAQARRYRVEGYKLSLEQLSELGHPAVVPVTIRSFKHFVVFRGRVNDHVVLADPAFGNTTITQQQFLKIWNGMALVITKTKADGFVSRLQVASDDALIAETPNAKHFVETTLSYGSQRRDEF